MTVLGNPTAFIIFKISSLSSYPSAGSLIRWYFHGNFTEIAASLAIHVSYLSLLFHVLFRVVNLVQWALFMPSSFLNPWHCRVLALGQSLNVTYNVYNVFSDFFFSMSLPYFSARFPLNSMISFYQTSSFPEWPYFLFARPLYCYFFHCEYLTSYSQLKKPKMYLSK